MNRTRLKQEASHFAEAGKTRVLSGAIGALGALGALGFGSSRVDGAQYPKGGGQEGEGGAHPDGEAAAGGATAVDATTSASASVASTGGNVAPLPPRPSVAAGPLPLKAPPPLAESWHTELVAPPGLSRLHINPRRRSDFSIRTTTRTTRVPWCPPAPGDGGEPQPELPPRDSRARPMPAVCTPTPCALPLSFPR